MTVTQFTDAVEVNGSQNIPQLTVQAHTTQTTPLQLWENSSSAPLARMTGDGRLQVGSFSGGEMATDDALIEAHRSETDTTKPARGQHLLGAVTGTLSSIVSWVVQELVLKGTGGVSALHSALRIRLTNENTGNAATADLRAGDLEAINSGGNSGQPVGTLTGMRAAANNATNGYASTAIGVRAEVNHAGASLNAAVGVDVVVTNSGTNLNNVYGVRVNNVDHGLVQSYALYTGLGVVHFGDVLELTERSTAPAPQPATVRIYPKTDGKLYTLNDSGEETALGSGGGGSAASILPNGSFEAWENGTATAPDGWVLTGSGATVAREATTVKHGNYSAKLTRVGNDCHLSFDVYAAGGKTYLRSRQYTLGAWVYATAANRVRLRVDDGTAISHSPYHTGTAGWEYLRLTFTPSASATVVWVGLAVDGGNTSGYIDGAIVVEGATASSYQPQIPSINDLPQRTMLFHLNDLVTVVAGAGWTVNALFASQLFGFACRQATAALGDAFTQSVWLRRGTYTFYALGLTSTSRGMLDWSLDGNTFIPGQSWYSATLTYNVVKSGAVTVDFDGYHVLKGTVSGGSNYFIDLTAYWFKPASD